MQPNSFELAFANNANAPAPDADGWVLINWLRRRLGRPPSWLEVLALRAGLRERARRLVWWRWWRRLRRALPPRQEDLVADFVLSEEGKILFGFLGGMTALLAQLALPDPWEGFDGRHPTTPRLSRRERLRERVAAGCAVPMREQITAVLAYAGWKLSGQGMTAQGSVPEAAEFLSPVHAAAINAMTGPAVMGVSSRLRHAGDAEAGRRAVLRELDRVGSEVLRIWPDMHRIGPGAPLGVWPPPDEFDGPAAPPIPVPPAPGAFRR